MIVPILGGWLGACSDDAFSSCDPGEQGCGAGTGGAPSAGSGGASGQASGSGTGGQTTASGGTTATGGGGATATGGSAPTSLAGDGGGGAGGASGDGGAGGAGGEGGAGNSCDGAASPADAPCLVGERYGVFVSPLGNDADGDGSRESPYATLANALAQANAQKKRVFACASAGAFEEDVLLDASLDQSALFGGFDCSDWSYLPLQPTEVKSSSTVALRATKLTALTIEDFAFSSSDAAEPGDSSVAGWIEDSAGVVLRRVALNAGTGAAGRDGTGIASAAQSGYPGNPGTAACTRSVSPNYGGVAVETSCDGELSGSLGGKGGNGGVDVDSAASGNPGKPTIGTGLDGAAGVGENGASWSCVVGSGQPGAMGISQPVAAGAHGPGLLAKTGFVPAAGENGVSGTPGQGGGGGGGALAPAACAVGRALTGASGGGGGSGGCGGKGGTGGEGGGASLALVSFNSTVTLDAVALSAASGGAGGKGGASQPGGKGGLGGAGASGPTSDSCGGGAGGRGGNGGAGGGGAGGPSVGIAFVGTAPVTLGKVTFQLPASAAAGGLDGKGLTGGAGALGAIAQSLGFQEVSP